MDKRVGGFILEFNDLRYSVETKTGKPCRKVTNHKEILKGISGKVEPGDLVALMGASGAGKSTLLNVLSRKIVSNTGDIRINGVPVGEVPNFLKKTAFIQQEDEFFGFLTVEEHLQQQADMRMNCSKALKQLRVEKLIAQFSLGKSRRSAIGNAAAGARRGISGGEKKRLSVATELIADPPLIFADEPTSGLDAFMAESVVIALKKLAESGHTIVCTIHQPASDVFKLFNKVLLLSEGQLIYYGPRLGALPYFLRLGEPCPPFTNPADFLIDVLAIDWDNPKNQLERFEEWALEWKQNGQQFLDEFKSTMLAQLEEEERKERDDSSMFLMADSVTQDAEKDVIHDALDTTAADVLLEDKPVSSWVVFCTLIQRTIITTARNPAVMRARLVQALITAIFTGLSYLRLKQNQWYSRVGATFNLLLNMVFMTVFNCIMPILVEKKMVRRERDAGLYSLSLYIINKICADTMFQFHLPLLLITIFWWMAALNDSFTRYLLGLATCWLMGQAAASLGYIVGCAAPNYGIAVAVAPLLILATMMVAGFVYLKASLPKFWIWLYYISPFHYGFSALMRSVFLNVDFGEPDPNSSFPYTKGNDILEMYELSTTSKGWAVDFLALAAWTIFGRVLAGFIYCYQNRQRIK